MVYYQNAFTLPTIITLTNAGDANRTYNGVELTGRVLASELDALLTAVRRVNGVSQITNRLIVLNREDQITGTQTDVAIPQM